MSILFISLSPGPGVPIYAVANQVILLILSSIAPVMGGLVVGMFWNATGSLLAGFLGLAWSVRSPCLENAVVKPLLEADS